MHKFLYLSVLVMNKLRCTIKNLNSLKLAAMMIDLRYKNAPLFAISIAFLLLNTAVVEAAPKSARVLARNSNTPDEALRDLVSARGGQGNKQQNILSSPSGVFSSPDATSSHQIATDRSLSNNNPLDIIVADITNRPTAAVDTQPTPSHPFAPPAQPVSVIPSPADLEVVQPTQSEPKSTSTESVVTDQIESSAPFSFGSEPAGASKTKGNQNGKRSKNNQAPQDTTETLQNNQEHTQPPGDQDPKKQPKSGATEENSTEPFIINKSIIPDNTVLPKKFDLGSVEKLTNKLVSGSQRLMLSIQSDYSARLFMGSTSLEIPPVLGSRLMLETAVEPPQATTLRSPDSSALLAQAKKPAKSNAIRLLLTDRDRSSDRKSAIAFSVIGTHWFANKPNV
jgi:hypothetical protein